MTARLAKRKTAGKAACFAEGFARPMNIAIRITSFCGLIAAFVLGLISPTQITAAERPPNVVVILVDDLGWNDLTWNGGGVAGGAVPTPQIDSLARACRAIVLPGRG